MISALLKSDSIGTCLMVQWLRPTTRGTGLISGQRTEIVYAAQSKKKKGSRLHGAPSHFLPHEDRVRSYPLWRRGSSPDVECADS